MTAGWRLRIAALALALGFAAAPVGAQNTVAPANASTDVIGPPQIQDFSLNGTVTREAETPPPRPQQTPQQQPSQPTATRTPTPDAAPSQQQAVRQLPAPQQEASTTARVETPAASPPSGLTAGSLFDLPPPTQAQPSALPPTVPSAADLPTTDSGSDDPSGLPMPWLVAFLAVAAAGAWYFFRQRSRLAYAGDVSEFAEPEREPRPEPLQRSPAPAPTPAPPEPPVPQGIVSTRLRPWIDLSVAPQSCRLAADGASVEFEVTVVNSGSGPARDVLVEAVMLNAGPAQDQQVTGFFERPAGQGERIPSIPPLKSMTLRSAVKMTAEQLQLFEVEGRKLFVPLLAFNALYRHGGGDAQTSAAFLVGRNGKGDKMAPFVLDQAPRQFGGLAARALEPSVRR